MAFLSKFSGSYPPNSDSPQSVLLKVSGMRCAGCVQSVEHQLLRQDGVAGATVNLVTQSARVELLPSGVKPEHLAMALTEAGFQSQVLDDQRSTGRVAELDALDIPQLLFAIALVGCSALGHLQDILPINLPVVGTMLFHGLLATLALVGPGRLMIIEGTRGLLRNQPTMDTLVSMGSVIAYMVSVTALLFPSLGWDCFFDATVMIIGLILLGRTLESQAKAKAKSSFQSLLSLQSPIAHRLPRSVDLEEGWGMHSDETVQIEAVLPGDRLLVFTGDHFPVDGMVLAGETHVDESMLTGESLPVSKQVGDPVTAGTINQQDPVVIEAIRTGAETTLAKITRQVEDAQTRKAPIQRVADRVAGYFTYGVMAIALLTFLFWWLWGTQHWPAVLEISSAMHPMTEMARPTPVLVSLKFAIAVLVIACPCALGLATPTALLVGTSVGAERGLLLRGGDVLERCSQLKNIVFDKTGTLTTGQLKVTDIFLSNQDHPLIGSAETLLQWIASVEQQSRHPLASAILAQAQSSHLFPVSAIEIVAGAGIAGTYQQHRIRVGTCDWLSQFQISMLPTDQERADSLVAQGKTVIYCAVDQQFVGAVALQDTLRPDAKHTLVTLEKMGLNTYILTGDRLENTQVLLTELGLSSTQIEANLSPSQKADCLRKIQQTGPVAMVGDGINDAPALAQADIGIALSSGTDVAMETAEIVLTRSQINGDQIQLDDIVQALRLSRATFRKIKQNLFWAFAYNLLGIPMAAGLLFPAFHIALSPSASAALMALSSVSVISNSILLQPQWRSA